MTSHNGTQQQVVVGVDGSAESVAALNWAAAYAATGARMRAVIAWHFPTAAGPAPVGVAPVAISDEVRQNMTDALGAAVAEGAPGRAAMMSVELATRRPYRLPRSAAGRACAIA